jgi:hypothetical protein
MLLKLEFSRLILEKSSGIKFNENLSSRRWAVPCRRTDRHAQANSLLFEVLQTCLKIMQGKMLLY